MTQYKKKIKDLSWSWCIAWSNLYWLKEKPNNRKRTPGIGLL